jgi:hypothetical protein
MCKDKHVCPSCKGTKQMTVVAQLYTDKGMVPQKPVVMDCFNCKGKGYLTDAERIQKEQEDQLWCKCKKDHGSTFVDDFQSDVCDKHHWTCNHCGKVTQVG